MSPERGCRGFTLIEAVIAIVILGVGVAAMLGGILQGVRHSGDPMLAEQANAIAQSYLEEVMLRPFCDPNDFSTDCPADCTAAACAACSGGSLDGGGAEARNTYDDVCDYAGLSDSAGAIDQSGSAVAGLEAYNVSVEVDDDATLNGLAGVAGQLLKVSVHVTHDSNPDVDVTLEAYRTNY